MVAKLKKEERITIWAVGAWYIRINHHNRSCAMTSGDYWFPITRQEAVDWIRHERKLQKAA